MNFKHLIYYILQALLCNKIKGRIEVAGNKLDFTVYLLGLEEVWVIVNRSE